MKKLAILAAIHNYGGLNKTEMNPTPGPHVPPVQGVNIMLGGAMLSAIIFFVFIMCYCCHKTNRKSRTNLPNYWRDPALSMEIFTVEAQNYFTMVDLSPSNERRPSTPGPPPAYDLVVPFTKEPESIKSNTQDDTGLPTYETAIQINKPNSSVTNFGHV